MEDRDEAILVSPLSRQRFADAYLAWAQDECRREVERYLPRLRRISSLLLVNTVAEMERWTKEEQLELMLAGVRARVFGEDFGDHAKVLSERVVGNLINGQERLEFQERARVLDKTHAYDRRFVRQQVEAQLAPLLGEHERDGLVTTFWSRFPGGTLRTDFDFGGRGRKLTYRHVVYGHEDGSDARSDRIHHWDISACDWLGLGGTTWEHLTNDGAASLASTLREWCAYFLSHIPSLVKLARLS